jgi:hypothetical protein
MLTEYDKTLTELYQINGRSGLHLYFVKGGLTDDQAEQEIDKLYITTNPITGKEIVSVLPFEESKLIAPIVTETVTFADGSTREIQTSNDSIVSSNVPVIETSLPDTDKTLLQKVEEGAQNLVNEIKEQFS